MEDIGTIVNENGKQYIKNLIGKNSNQISIHKIKFSSLDVDKLIDYVNIYDNIISIVIKYDNISIDINYIIFNNYSNEEQNTIKNKTNHFMNNYFNQMKYNIHFLQSYEHDCLKKFKIIVKKNDTDSEPVGGYFRPT